MYTFIDKNLKKVLVIQIPKNASLTIGSILYSKHGSFYYNLWDNYYNDHIPFVYGKHITDYDYSIAFVRNPYSRMLSRFSYLTSNPYHKDYFKNFNLSDFILKKPEIKPEAWMPWSWRQQVEYISVDGTIKVDFVYRLEQVSVSSVFSNLLGCDIPDIKENTSNSQKYLQFLTDDLKKEIYRTYLNDFSMLGYEP